MNDEQLLKYSRHILMPDVDVNGQEKILASTVMIVGLGGLGSPVAMYLAASGVGKLLINDFDEVDSTNLQRQILFSENSIGMLKTQSAFDRLVGINSASKITALEGKLTEKELHQYVAKADVVVDCSDNFETRFALNKVCVERQTILVSGAAIRMEGQVASWYGFEKDGACYQCLYEEHSESEESCNQSGVLSPVTGVIGSLQAVEVLKILTGAGQTLRNSVLLYDGAHSVFRKVKVNKLPACNVCQSR